MILKGIPTESVQQYNLPVPVKERNNFKNQLSSQKKVIENKEKLKNKTVLEEDKIFDAIEKNTIFLKDSSNENKKFLINKVKELINQKKEDIWPEKETKDTESFFYIFEDKDIAWENTSEITTEDILYEESKTYFKEESENKEKDYESSFSFEGLRRKILDTLNLDSLTKMISGQKEIISSLAKASKEVFNFIGNVTENISSLSSRDRMKNMASLKGLMFDALA